jgi:fermentation-respiration switch protein FrsA (DUF1100 family)
MRKRVMSYLLTGLFCYLFLYGWVAFNQRSFIYFPDTDRPNPAHYPMQGIVQADITTADNLALQSWYKPPAEGMPVIVIFHGNAGHYAMRSYKMQPYAELGYGVLLAGYRGYGGNPGAPSEEGFYKDGRANIAWLKTQGIAGQDIILYGESIGSGVAVQIATEINERALILEAPFDSLARVAGRRYFFFLFARHVVQDKFENDRKIAQIGSPLLIVAGGRDAIIPIQHPKRLFAAANEPKTLHLVQEGGHNDLYNRGAVTVVKSFLDAVH